MQGGASGQVPLKPCASTRPTRSLSTQRHTPPPRVPKENCPEEGHALWGLEVREVCQGGQQADYPRDGQGRRHRGRREAQGKEGGTGRGLEPAHGSSSCRKSRVCSTDRQGVQWLFRSLGWQEAEWDLQPVLWARAVLPRKGGGGALKSNWG